VINSKALLYFSQSHTLREYTLFEIAEDPALDELFTEVCVKNRTEENYEFFKSVVDYDNLEDSGERRLYDLHFTIRSKLEYGGSPSWSWG
jgi:hypothetical protein